jgi:type VI secretion system secreted protein Hcp
MALDMFLKLEKIEGESKDKEHTNEIDVLAWSWGMSQSGSWHHGGGGGAGKVNAQDISFTKYIDKATPDLMIYLATGDHIPEATLTVRKAGKKPLEYVIFTMKKVMITSISTGGSGGEDRLTENITLNFAEGKFGYDEQDEKGGGKGMSHFEYSFERNEKL